MSDRSAVILSGGSAWAGKFDGNVQINGDLLVSGDKTFRIDHPLDPGNKFLVHYSTEGPEPLNTYSGNISLDDNGEARVELPPYFEALNRDFRYQLTCVGAYAPVYIAQTVQNNRFRIAGGAPGLTVSWTVSGVRNDTYVQTHGIQAERDKAAEPARSER